MVLTGLLLLLLLATALLLPVLPLFSSEVGRRLQMALKVA
jgi:hypothetical protein